VTEGRATGQSDEDVISLRWIRIDRKTDFVALTAFLLALFSALYQLKEWVKGPEVFFYAPDRVIVYSYKQSNNIPIIRIAAPMSYNNTASSEYSTAIKNERVLVKVGQIQSAQEWVSFGRLARDVSGFNPQITADASPVPLPGGNSVSHSTFFGPSEVDCGTVDLSCKANQNYISTDAMTAAIGDAHTMYFEFTAEVFSSQKLLTQECTVNITEAVVEQWSEENWLIAHCIHKSDQSPWERLFGLSF
jgi:hypothetical protein